jgi:hypothetical protein
MAKCLDKCLDWIYYWHTSIHVTLVEGLPAMDFKRAFFKFGSVLIHIIFLALMVISFSICPVPPASVEASEVVFPLPVHLGSNALANNIQTTDIVVGNGGATIYLTLQGFWGETPVAHSRCLLKSATSGASWVDITSNLPNVIVNTDYVAVAPDDSNLVMVVDKTSSSAVISTNGGLSFFDLGIPESAAHTAVATIFDIDVSKPFTDLYGNTYRYVGVAGVSSGGGAAFYFCKFGAYTPFAWDDAVTAFTGTGYTTDDARFFAVKFSPAFGIDNIAYLLSQDGTSTNVELHVFSFNLPGNWDNHITGYSMYGTGEGVPICALGAVTVTKGQIIFDLGYSGVYYSPYARTAYCSVAASAGGGAFRITENASAIPSTSPLVSGPVWSIALNATGSTLVSAAASSNTIYTVVNPSSAFPAVDVAPEGESHTLVAFAGTNVIAATSGAGSGISLSADLGVTFPMVLPYILAAPVLLSPPDNADDVSFTPTFSWEAVNYASSYEFQLAIDNMFTAQSLVYVTTTVNTELVLPDGLLIDQHSYYWRVRSLGGLFPYTWSTFTFTVNPGAAPPFWPWPAGGGALVVIVGVTSLIIKNQLIKSKTEKTIEQFEKQGVSLKITNTAGQSLVNPDTPLKADIAIDVRLTGDVSQQSVNVEGPLLRDGKEAK